MLLARMMTAAAASALLAGAAYAQATTSGSQSAASPASAAASGSAQGAGAAQAGAQSPAAPAAASAGATTQASGDLVATARAAGQFNTLLKAADATGLTPVLKGAGPITVFAPTDAAFAALPAGELDRLMQPGNAQELQRLLANHVVNARVTSEQLAGKKGTVPAVGGATLNVDGAEGGVVVNGSKVVRADVAASNGVIHVIDKVILPGAGAATASPTAAAETSSVASTDTPSAGGADPSATATASADQTTATDSTATASAPPASSAAGSTQTAEAAPATDAAPTQTAEASAAPADSAAANASATAPSASAAVGAATNGPVADTPENRKRYRPLSGAGRRSAARGN